MSHPRKITQPVRLAPRRAWRVDVTALEAEDYERAFRKLEPAAESRIAGAQFYLAQIYDHGMDVSKDPLVAYRWYSKAAEFGLPNAQAMVVYSLDEGIEVERDDMEAADWYRNAGKQHHVIAQRSLALMCEEGEGMERDGERRY